jgi:hypothetical protein
VQRKRGKPQPAHLQLEIRPGNHGLGRITGTSNRKDVCFYIRRRGKRMSLRKGEQVEFAITGCIPLFRGVVEDPAGHYGQPEIRVTHVRRGNEWVPEEGWPTLKDGDYIIRAPQI